MQMQEVLRPYRTVIQLVAAGTGQSDKACLVALCSDGSMWIAISNTKWERLADIPQGEN